MRLVFGVFCALLLCGCVDRSVTEFAPEAVNIGTVKTVFAGSTRARDPDGIYGFNRSEQLALLDMSVSIPPDREPGSLKFSYANPDPKTEFTLVSETKFPDTSAFQRAVQQELANLPPGSREVSLFIHGYNATQTETAFRATQIFYDLDVPGVDVIYSWPSRGAVLGYVYDHDSALFARDGLEELLRILSDAGADRIIVVAHSMGSVVLTETLRQMDLARPGWPARNIGGVILISPDINVDVFRTFAQRMNPLPQPFLILTSGKDRALNLSARISGSTDRLGTLQDLERVADLPVRIVDVTAFSGDAGSSHLVAATSPALLTMASNASAVNNTFLDPGVIVPPSIAGQADIEASEDAVRVVIAPPGEDR